MKFKIFLIIFFVFLLGGCTQPATDLNSAPTKEIRNNQSTMTEESTSGPAEPEIGNKNIVPPPPPPPPGMPSN